MDMSTYQYMAMRTKPELSTNYRYLELARIGMIGEVGEIAELIKKNDYHDKPLDRVAILKECGDFMWYLALYCDATQMMLQESRFSKTPYSDTPPARCCIHLARHVGILCEARLDTAIWSVYDAMDWINSIAHHYNSNIDEVIEMNIEKLEKRYPEGFDIKKSATHDGQ